MTSVTFTKVTASRWEATDGADKYEIQRGRNIGYACIKNTVWFETCASLTDAVAVCEAEQEAQEWYTLNPENAAKAEAARELRRKQRNYEPPKLWRGK